LTKVVQSAVTFPKGIRSRFVRSW